LHSTKKDLTFAKPSKKRTKFEVGAVAQLVEQWTENPCVFYCWLLKGYSLMSV